MLTATYSVIAMTVEWQNAHGSLAAIEQDISQRKQHPVRIDSLVLESTVDKLSQIAQSSHSRQLEQYVIPEIKKSTAEADALLDELDTLKVRGMALLRSVRDRLQSVFEQGLDVVEELCSSLQLYCKMFYERLNREERLVEIAQRVIPAEGWFSIAVDLLADQAENAGRKESTQHALRAPIPALSA